MTVLAPPAVTTETHSARKLTECDCVGLRGTTAQVRVGFYRTGFCRLKYCMVARDRRRK